MATEEQAPKLVYDTSTPPSITTKTMELLPLYNDRNPMLAMKQEEFDMKNPPVNVIAFANQLLYTMNHYRGVGLAAPQCGEPYRMFVMEGGIVCINPTIIEASKETAYRKEGCLSFPGLVLPVTRPNTVRMRYTDEFGASKEVTWTGTTARIAQHEYDHLQGIVFTSRVGSLTLQMAKKKRVKLFKKIERTLKMREVHNNLEAALNKKRPASITPYDQHITTEQIRPVEIQSNRVT